MCSSPTIPQDGDALLSRAVDELYTERERADAARVEVGVRDMLLAHALAGLRFASALLEDQECRASAGAEICGAHMRIIWSQRRQLAAYRRLLRQCLPVDVDGPDIVEMVGRVVALCPIGDRSGWVGDCPWCGTAGSFHVFPDFQRFSCADCGDCGDIWAFVERFAPDRGLALVAPSIPTDRSRRRAASSRPRRQEARSWPR
jgi:hypothetical protein